MNSRFQKINNYIEIHSTMVQFRQHESKHQQSTIIIAAAAAKPGANINGKVKSDTSVKERKGQCPLPESVNLRTGFGNRHRIRGWRHFRKGACAKVFIFVSWLILQHLKMNRRVVGRRNPTNEEKFICFSTRHTHTHLPKYPIPTLLYRMFFRASIG